MFECHVKHFLLILFDISTVMASDNWININVDVYEMILSPPNYVESEIFCQWSMLVYRSLKFSHYVVKYVITFLLISYYLRLNSQLAISPRQMHLSIGRSVAMLANGDQQYCLCHSCCRWNTSVTDHHSL